MKRIVKDLVSRGTVLVASVALILTSMTALPAAGAEVPRRDGDVGMAAVPSGDQSQPLGVVAIAAGYQYSLALRVDGTVWGWGRNDDGQVGDGTTKRRFIPVRVVGLSDVVAIAASGYHSLAITRDGTVWAWGNNWSGQLGDGTTTRRLIPVEVVGLTDVVAIAAGNLAHSLAVRSDGTAWAWGNNSYGQVGDGTTINRSTPVQVKDLTGVQSVSAGYRHSLAVKSGGTAWAWGYNRHGTLGDGTRDDRSTPVRVKNLTGVQSVSAGGGHSLEPVKFSV